ncbi:MAG: TlpA disulfide reductase family protein [Bryobacteraceae bacterium]
MSNLISPTKQKFSSFRRRAATVAAGLMLFCCSAWPQMPPGGRPLPDVPVKTGPNSSVDLKQFRGKPLVIGLISSTCDHCVKAMNTFRDLQTKYRADGLRVVVAIGDPIPITEVTAFAEKHRANFPVGFLNQPEFIKMAALKPGQRPFVPIVMFVDPKGMVRLQYFGDDAIMKSDVNAAITLTTEHLLKDSATTTAKK